MSLGVSIGLHLVLFLLLHFFASPGAPTLKNPLEPEQALETRSISEKDFEEVMRQNERKQIVQKIRFDQSQTSPNNIFFPPKTNTSTQTPARLGLVITKTCSKKGFRMFPNFLN
jgi:hypothetical protein